MVVDLEVLVGINNNLQVKATKVAVMEGMAPDLEAAIMDLAAEAGEVIMGIDRDDQC